MGHPVGRTYPDRIEEIKVGDVVQRGFQSSDGVRGETMWIEVAVIHSGGFVSGPLTNDPLHKYIPPLKHGDTVAVNLFEMLDWSRGEAS